MNKLYKLKVSQQHSLQGGSVMTVNMVEVKNLKATKSAVYTPLAFGWKRVK